VTRSAWRITKARHTQTAFTGEGARLFGGRWNSVGTAMVYCSEHASLSILELLVHLGPGMGLSDYVLLACSFDEGLVDRVDGSALPAGWRESPPLVDVQTIGDRWVQDARSAVLQVPSAVVPIEWNYLLNPQHPDFSQVQIGAAEPFAFDPRLSR
jgi:RES domain-containing protein